MQAKLKQLTNTWKNHWFSDEPSINFDVARILTAIALLLALYRLGNPFAPFVYKDFSTWNPSGVLKLFGKEIPSTAFLSASGGLAIFFTVLWGLGALTFISGPLSLFFSLIAFSIRPSFTHGWSHGYTFNLLVQIPLVLSPIAGQLSVDAFLKRVKAFSWMPFHGKIERIRWPLILSFWLLGIAFFGVSLVKTLGNYNLGWIFSDNLRNVIFWRYQWRDEVPPDFANWLSNNEWAWKFSALGNCLLQMVPILACIFSRHNWIRLFASLAIALEVLGLAVVMRLNNWHWYPIAFIFVNWVWLAKYFKYDTATELKAIRPIKEYAISAFLFAFLGYYSFLHFYYKNLELDFKHNNYPITGHRMYAGIKARKPYDQHLPFRFFGTKIEVDLKEGDLPEEVKARLPKIFVNSERLNTEKQILQQLKEIKHYLLDSGVQNIQGIKLYRSVYEAPPYPAPLAKVEAHKNLIGSVVNDKTEFYVFEHGYENGKPFISLKKNQTMIPIKGIKYKTNIDENSTPLTGTPVDGKFFYNKEVPKYIIFEVRTTDNQDFISFYLSTKKNL